MNYKLLLSTILFVFLSIEQASAADIFKKLLKKMKMGKIGNVVGDALSVASVVPNPLMLEANAAQAALGAAGQIADTAETAAKAAPTSLTAPIVPTAPTALTAPTASFNQLPNIMGPLQPPTVPGPTPLQSPIAQVPQIQILPQQLQPQPLAQAQPQLMQFQQPQLVQAQAPVAQPMQPRQQYYLTANPPVPYR